jgi:TonB family protein
MIVHGGLLAWLVIASSVDSGPPARSLYNQEIRPYEHKIIWYSLKNKLPDVRPTESLASPRQPQALKKFNQAMAAAHQAGSRAAQKIWLPEAPKLDPTKPEPLPNLLAVAPPAPKPVKQFRAPVTAPSAVHAALPELPPAVTPTPLKTAALPLDLPPERAPVREFIVPPVGPRPTPVKSALPAPPPAVAPPRAKFAALPLDLPPQRAPLRKFVAPPDSRTQVKPAAALPQPPPPALASAASTAPKPLPFNAPPPRAVRAFVPPPATKTATKSPAAVPSAPETPLLIQPPNSAATMAIAGLDPAKTMEIPKPPAPRDAGFSGGPKRNPNGSESAPEKAMLTVPDLMIHGGAPDPKAALAAAISPTSRQNLLSAMRMPPPTSPASETAGAPRAARVSSSPDPRMQGRAIYVMAIQTQQVTSYSGNWMVWFAEHQPLPGAPPLDVQPPDPLREVDPKYIASAAEERVEGVVRLSAVIRKDGRVDSIEVLKPLDGRLDRSAAEALARWVFKPASRGGAPVDVDAVFEVPFRLAPREAK